MRWLATIAIAAILVLDACLPRTTLGRRGSDPELRADVSGAVALVGEPLPDFELQDIDGRPFSLSEHRGRWVVLEVWRTWCGPCVGELPHLQYAHRLLEADGLSVLLVSGEPAELQQGIRRE